jgi:hypothetical protein
MNDQEIPDSSKPVEDSSITGSPETSTPYSGQPDDLNNLFEAKAPTNPDDEDPLAALRNDPNYEALIRDLEYIAKEARNLFNPVEEDPSDQVWTNIQRKLESEPPDA